MFVKDSMKFWTISWEHNDIRVEGSRHIEVRVDSWSEVVNIVRSLLGREPVYADHRTFEDDKYLKVWHLDVGQNDEDGPRVNISEERILLGWTSPLVVARMVAEEWKRLYLETDRKAVTPIDPNAHEIPWTNPTEVEREQMTARISHGTPPQTDADSDEGDAYGY